MLNLILRLRHLLAWVPTVRQFALRAIANAGFNKDMESTDLNRPLVVKMFSISAYSSL
jgi:hypothetical protein